MECEFRTGFVRGGMCVYLRMLFFGVLRCCFLALDLGFFFVVEVELRNFRLRSWSFFVCLSFDVFI